VGASGTDKEEMQSMMREMLEQMFASSRYLGLDDVKIVIEATFSKVRK
jgi:hypothetical protein